MTGELSQAEWQTLLAYKRVNQVSEEVSTEGLTTCWGTLEYNGCVRELSWADWMAYSQAVVEGFFSGDYRQDSDCLELPDLLATEAGRSGLSLGAHPSSIVI